MRHPYRTTFLIVSTIILLTGCSTSQTFQLILSVRNKTDGKPVSDVQVTIDTLGIEERKFDMDYGWPRATTDADGRLSQDFMVSPYPNDRYHWYLRVSKEGFEPLVIDIKPATQPPKTTEASPLKVDVELEPIKKAAN
jgi:hypothetical protein